MAEGDLRRRLAVAGVGIPLGVLVIYLGVWTLGGVLSVVAAIGAREFYLLAEAGDVRPFRLLGMGAAGALVLSAAWAGSLTAWSLPALGVVLGIGLLALVVAVFFRGLEGAPLASVASTLLGVVYLGVTLSFAVHLRRFPGISDGAPGWEGAIILIFPLFVTWIGDSAAYFTGRRWGRTKLIPAISPGKTVAGAVGGMLGAVVAAVTYSILLINPFSGAVIPWLLALILGLVVGCIAQLGDLAESLLKREAGVKDSGNIFPGHGGVLDRFDSVLFALPVTYVLLVIVLLP